MIDRPPQVEIPARISTPGVTSTRPGPLARLSLGHKLPLMMVALSLALMGGLSVVAIVEVRTTTESMGSERLSALTQQFAALFAASGNTQRAGASAIASRPELAEFARTRSAGARARALGILQAQAANAPGPEQFVTNELRDAKGHVLLSSRPGIVDTMSVADVVPLPAGGDSVAIGGFRRLRDTLVFPAAMRVKGSDDVYAVRWRRVLISARTKAMVDQLIGTYATPYLGNPRGKYWVNFRSIVAPPPLDYASTAPTQRFMRGDQAFIASTARLAGTPWMVALEVPMTTVLAPAMSFQRRFLLLAVLALAIVLLAVTVLSRRLTKPLVQLAEAATAISEGDFSHPVRIQRSDEIGRLGSAFSTMATEVLSTRNNLERKVEERTAQLHEAQEALVRRERLALLGQLSSGVGHELRNPLGVMTNAVYLLRTVLADPPQNVTDYLDILQQQIAMSEKIVSDLLDFARSRQPQRTPTSLSDVSAQQVERLGSMEGVQIESTLNGHLPAAMVDASQAGQIILNLLANAVQAIDGPGLIRIRGVADGDRVHIDVMDSGPGVHPEQLEKIFEPLFTTKARGLGLGLSVSRTLARANGGDLTASNNPSGGAVFRLTLPIAVPELV